MGWGGVGWGGGWGGGGGGGGEWGGGGGGGGGWGIIDEILWYVSYLVIVMVQNSHPCESLEIGKGGMFVNF